MLNFVSNLRAFTRLSRAPSTRLTFLAYYYIWHRIPALNRASFGLRLGRYRFWVRPADRGGFEEVLLKREYSFAAHIVAQSPTTPVVIDVGANVGLFSLAMLEACPGTILYSLEPSLDTFRILLRNARANPASRWSVYNLALWKTGGPLKFGNTAASTSSRIYELAPEGEVEIVEAVTLGDFVDRHAVEGITLLKLDIEGAEEAVLAEGEAVLASVQNLVVEIHPPRASEAQVMGILRDCFPYVYIVPGRRSSKPLILASQTYAEFPE